jgi:class 3 adenylate cyclase
VSRRLAIVFADVSGSTRIYERHGDDTARAVIARCLDVLRDVTLRHGGTVIKYIGDEALCTFLVPDDAGLAVCDMQEAIAELDTSDLVSGGLALSIRVGLHYGPALMEGGDVYGDAVNVAARMASEAKAGQIITTRETFEGFGPILKASCRLIARENVKGKSETMELHELLWLQDDATRMGSGVLKTMGSEPGCLTLAYRGRTFNVNAEHTRTVLGRSSTAEVTVDESLASRQHAVVEFRRGRFFLIDQSLNGTYLLLDGDEHFLRREEMPLNGSGQISLGRPFHERPSGIITFDIAQ